MTIEDKLREIAFANIFQFELTPENTCYLDFSSKNQDPEFLEVASSDQLENYIWKKFEAEGKKYGIGGYAENRVLYRRFEHFNSGQGEERCIHLGSDLWCDAHEPIFAPLDGVVHSFKNNDNKGDYGATIILKHSIQGITFFTLYGHLSLQSLDGKEENQLIRSGDQFASLGDHNENGGWPPHLHFQVIKDLEGNKGDYPGVVSKSEAEKYLQNCPDPKFILGLR